MKALHRGVALALLQALIVLGVAGKYAWDRDHLPRAWARTVPYDSEQMVRGRYLSLNVFLDAPAPSQGTVRLIVQNGHLAGVDDLSGTGERVVSAGKEAELRDSIPFFLPEHAANLTRRAPGEELWVEVSVPRRGSPRPIRLGVKKNGMITPLDLR
jgi:hypothetical protein